MCTHPRYDAGDMPKVIQIRDVPDDVRDALAEAADAEGLSLTRYVRRELEHLARRSRRVRDNAAVVRRTQSKSALKSTATLILVRAARRTRRLKVVDAGVIVELVAGGLDPDRLGVEDLAAPHLLDSEVTHVLRGLVLRGALTDEQAALAMGGFAELAIARYPADWLTAAHVGAPPQPQRLRRHIRRADRDDRRDVVAHDGRAPGERTGRSVPRAAALTTLRQTQRLACRRKERRPGRAARHAACPNARRAALCDPCPTALLPRGSGSQRPPARRPQRRRAAASQRCARLTGGRSSTSDWCFPGMSSGRYHW